MREIVDDLKTISAMQKRLLPRETPQPDGWRLAVHYQIGRWPGGNLYDFLPLPDGRILLLLADASEHGGPATALAALVRVFVHSCPLSTGREQSDFCPMQGEFVQAPHLLLQQLNQVVAENALEGQSLSVFCGILSPAEGTLHFANAGHPSPRWWHARTGAVESLRFAVGLPLGIDPRASYHHKRVEIETGDVLVFYTTGIHAALGGEGEFGLRQFDAALKESASAGADVVKNAVVSAWRAHVGPNAEHDDVTLLVLQRHSRAPWTG